MQNIFQPHPFSTAIGTLTERATDSGQPSEDWALILEICDTVNETDDGPKEAIRAIKKRLVTSAGKDNVSIWYTLTLLETLVKNCGKRFHSHVANKEFLHAFLKLLSPKNDPPQHLQTKVLYMLKCWISSNWDVVGKRDLEKVYASLLQKGVQFPTVAPVDCYVAKPSRCLSVCVTFHIIFYVL
ncbi:TOM1-like protein 2 [Schistosoma japonicum]|nr:TOM1-like protein 2 [Schistosoma japonicum]